MKDGTPRVLLVRIGAIGNALVAVPAIRALREAWPEAYLCLAGNPLTLELLEGCPFIDDFVRYDNRGPEKAGLGYFRFIMDLRQRRFTHAVMFRRYLRSELIGLFSGARARVGFRTGSAVQYLNRKVDYAEGENVIEQNLKLARALGVPAEDRRLELWPPAQSARVDAALAEAGGDGPLAVIHPAGSTQAQRLWPGFAELSRRLREQLGARVVMIGAEAERGMVESAAKSAGAAAAAGLRLPEVALLIKKADVFAGTDSGPAHIADAVGTPGAIVYAPHKGIPRQIAKWKPEGSQYLAFTPETDCGECGNWPCPNERQKECAASISVEDVFAGVRGLLTSRGGPQ